MAGLAAVVSTVLPSKLPGFLCSRSFDCAVLLLMLACFDVVVATKAACSCDCDCLSCGHYLYWPWAPGGGNWARPPPRGPPPETALARLRVRAVVCVDVQSVMR